MVFLKMRTAQIKQYLVHFRSRSAQEDENFKCWMQVTCKRHPDTFLNKLQAHGTYGTLIKKVQMKADGSELPWPPGPPPTSPTDPMEEGAAGETAEFVAPPRAAVLQAIQALSQVCADVCVCMALCVYVCVCVCVCVLEASFLIPRSRHPPASLRGGFIAWYGFACAQTLHADTASHNLLNPLLPTRPKAP